MTIFYVEYQVRSGPVTKLNWEAESKEDVVKQLKKVDYINPATIVVEAK
jgi:hypothetical protein